MPEKPGHETGWDRWMQNGRLATIVWLFVLLVTITLSIFKIDAPYMTQILTAMTGLWIGNLTLAAKKKSDDADDS